MFHSTTLFYVFMAVLSLSESFLRLTNFQCTAFHPDFASFSVCRLNLVKRGTVTLNLHVNLWQLPVNNVSVNLSLHKKESGYRPFLNNVSFDFCKFQRNPKRNPFAKMIFDAVAKYSNINHTCPFDHDIIMTNFTLREDMFQHFPLPEGDYMLQYKVAAYNDWKANVKLFARVELSLG